MNKQIEIEKIKIALNYLVKERMNSRGYLDGVSLKEQRGRYKEKMITNMYIVGDDVYILTDNYKFKKPLTQVKNIIDIFYEEV